MKDQLISFNTAKLAKKKGFDLLTVNGITEYNVIKSGKYNLPMDWNGSDFISCPTQSLLQKWLREKHNIEVISLRAEDFMFYKYKVSNIKKLKINLKAGFEFNTYEEALEKGLQEALKLIK